MDRKRAKELLPIIQAYAEGKDIQYRITDGDWNDDPDFDPFAQGFACLKYRIKPEPREFLLYLKDDFKAGDMVYVTGTIPEIPANATRVREVL